MQFKFRNTLRLFHKISLIALLHLTIATISAEQKTNNETMVLNIPSDIDFPKESLSLTIQLPHKVKPATDIEQITRKKVKRRFNYKSRPIKEISPKSRFREIMTNLSRKGLLTSVHDLKTSRNKYVLREQAARIVIKAYRALVFLDKRNELKVHKIRTNDLRDLKELVDEFQKQIKMWTYLPTEMHKKIDQLIDKVGQTHGKGTIRITSIKESDDGTLVQLEINKN